MAAISDIAKAITIPLVLIILLVVYGGFAENAATNIAETITNESITVASNATSVTGYPIESITEISNYSTVFTVDTDYVIANARDGTITTKGKLDGTDISDGVYNVTYSGCDRTRGACDAWDKLDSGTNNGFDLASMLPYVIIGMMLLALLMRYLGVI